jgi:5-methylcytosine-specific restriction enzyme subunit McrC
LQRELRDSTRRIATRTPPLTLDAAGAVPLRPDISVLTGTHVVWVADVKYKRLPSGAYQNADLYQMLAYIVALDLRSGTIIYAADEGVKTADHVVPAASKRIRVVALNLSAPPQSILRQLSRIAESVRLDPAP